MLPHMAAHLYGVPLMIHRPKLDVILAVLGERLGRPSAEAGNVPLALTRPTPPSAAGIAVIPIYGTLVKRTLGLNALSGLTSYQGLGEQLDAALADPQIAGILLDIDSAGGEASGVFDLADAIYAARQQKPIYAVANDVAFSAAYALASAASKVFVTRTGGLGSIGVIAMHVDQSAKDKQDGLRYTPIYAGRHKNDLSPHDPLSDAARAGLQTEVDRLYHLFVETVMRNRHLAAEVIRGTDAGLFFGPDAVAAGLADGIATAEQALTELIDFTQRPVRGFSMKEMHMQTTAATAGPTGLASTAEDPPPPPLTATPPPLSMAEAVEIADLCLLAGCPEAIAAYLAAQSPVAKVRQDLLQKRAQSTPISSFLAPSPAGATASDDVMLKAVQKKLSTPTHSGA